MHIDELQFLVGDAVSLIELGKYQIVLILESSHIAIYSKIIYTNKNRESSTIEAEGSKVYCPFTEILEKNIDRIKFEAPAYLVLEFNDRTRLKILGDGSGYEAFLVNLPDGSLYVFM